VGPFLLLPWGASCSRQRLLAADGAALHLGRRSVPQGRLPLRRHAGAKVLEAGHPRARGAAARAGAAGLQLMDGELDWGGLRRCATRGAEATALGRQRPAERGLNEHAAVGGCQPFGGPLAESGLEALRAGPSHASVPSGPGKVLTYPNPTNWKRSTSLATRTPGIIGRTSRIL
ncbi:unnamed protein product, partial [Prorocentrum cordatum]